MMLRQRSCSQRALLPLLEALSMLPFIIIYLTVTAAEFCSASEAHEKMYAGRTRGKSMGKKKLLAPQMFLSFHAVVKLTD